jgi:hypothetical protein
MALHTLHSEPSSFARLRRADCEMKHVKNKDFLTCFEGAVAPGPVVALTPRAGDFVKNFAGKRQTFSSAD